MSPTCIRWITAKSCNCAIVFCRWLAWGAVRKIGTDGRPEKVFVLVIAMGERKLGLLVNAIEGEEELVIKALDDQTAETDLVSGASILGNGQVVLILNLAAIVERFAKSRPGYRGGPAMGLLLSHSERARVAQSAQEDSHERLPCACWWSTIQR